MARIHIEQYYWSILTDLNRKRRWTTHYLLLGKCRPERRENIQNFRRILKHLALDITLHTDMVQYDVRKSIACMCRSGVTVIL